MTPPAGVDILDGMATLADWELEYNLPRIAAAYQAGDEIVVDLRFKEWMDLWALMQVLFLVDDRGKRGAAVWVVSPEDAVPLRDEDVHAARRRAHRRLQFLSDSQFLDRASESGAQIWKHRPAKGQYVPATADELRQDLLSMTIPAGDFPDDRPLIPITRIGQLDLDRERDQLFRKARDIFGRFSHEEIVSDGGIGDCLLSELVLNVRHHGHGVGFVALRSGTSLTAQHREQTRSRRGRWARTHHPLSDWRAYFSLNAEEQYLELVVCDRGDGIASTILADPRLPPGLAEPPKTPADVGALVAYALEAESSKLSEADRRRLGLADFTGLGAVSLVTSNHRGALLVRERQTRHSFAGRMLTQASDHSDSVRSPNLDGAQSRLAALKGVAVTAVIPVHRAPLVAGTGRPTRPTESGSAIAAWRGDVLSVVIRGPRQRSEWKAAVRQLADARRGSIVAVDLREADVAKNVFWPGFAALWRTAATHSAPLYLAGLSPRVAARLDEFVKLAGATRPEFRERALLGLSDDGTPFAFAADAAVAASASSRDRLARLFSRSTRPTAAETALLARSNYVDASDPEGPPLPTPPGLRLRVLADIAENTEHAIRQTPAWLPGQTVALTDGTLVRGYLLLDSVFQNPIFVSNIARLAVAYASSLAFDTVISVGALCEAIGRRIADAAARAAPQPPVAHHLYHDLATADPGDSPPPGTNPRPAALLLVDGIRRGTHARHVIRQLSDLGWNVVALVALFDLRGDWSTLDGVPVQCAIRVPVRDAPANSSPTLLCSPFSRVPHPPAPQPSHSWRILRGARATYRYLETYGLILEPHVAYLTQHSSTSIALPFLFDSSTSCLADLLHELTEHILRSAVDTILFPEASAVSRLVQRVLASRQDALVAVRALACRWPHARHSYEADPIAAATLRAARSVLIVDDQLHSGSTLRSLLALALRERSSLTRLSVFVAVDSQTPGERAALEALLSPLLADSRFALSLTAFTRLAMLRYSEPASCPVCHTTRTLRSALDSVPGLAVEQAYYRRRLAVLAIRDTVTDSGVRQRSIPLPKRLDLRPPSFDEIVTVRTVEGLHLLCEEAYVRGDISWLVELLALGGVDELPPEQQAFVIALLARDSALVTRLRQRAPLTAKVKDLLLGGRARGLRLGAVLEALSTWPISWLADFWHHLWTAFITTVAFADLIASYPSALYLLRAVGNSGDTRHRAALLGDFDQLVQSQIEAAALAAGSGSPDKYTDPRQRAQVLLCVRRGGLEQDLAFTTISRLVADASYILAYTAPEKSDHWVLRRGLANLACAQAATEAADLSYAVLLASHLARILVRATRLDDSFQDLTRHPDFNRVLAAADRLSTTYPGAGILGHDAAVVSECAATLSMLLYERNERNGFGGVLERLLRQMQTPVNVMLKGLLKLEHDGRVELSWMPPDARTLASRLFGVLSIDAVELAFGEVARNLAAIADGRAGGQRSLFEASQPIRVAIEISSSLSELTVSISNSCSQEQSKLVADGTGGTGLGQIENALRRFNATYERSFQQADGRLVQRIRLARVLQ